MEKEKYNEWEETGLREENGDNYYSVRDSTLTNTHYP